MNTYDIGDVVELPGNFGSTKTGEPFYPDDVTCRVEDPAGEITDLEVELVDEDDEKYFLAKVAPEIDGVWQARMVGTHEGEPVAAAPNRFRVRKPNVPLD
jgi:nitrogen fixation protein FixH